MNRRLQLGDNVRAIGAPADWPTMYVVCTAGASNILSCAYLVGQVIHTVNIDESLLERVEEEAPVTSPRPESII
jgi:hypothetical protein